MAKSKNKQKTKRPSKGKVTYARGSGAARPQIFRKDG